MVIVPFGEVGGLVANRLYTFLARYLRRGAMVNLVCEGHREGVVASSQALSPTLWGGVGVIWASRSWSAKLGPRLPLPSQHR